MGTGRLVTGREVTLPVRAARTDAVCTTCATYIRSSTAAAVVVLNMGLKNKRGAGKLQSKRVHTACDASLRASACVVCFSQCRRTS